MGIELCYFGGSVTTPDLNDNASQLRLPFPDTVTGFDDLAVTDANRAAIETVKNWQKWQANKLCLIGPVRCGLGVIARLWARDAEAMFMSASEFDALDIQAVEALSDQNCAIDLADMVDGESQLLMLLNLSQAKGSKVLLTARSAGQHWQCGSADLRSRLATMPVVEIYPPDEAMIQARLQASARRRFIKLGEATISFLAIRLPRSYLAIDDYMGRLDQAISDTGRAPSIKLAKDVLEGKLSAKQHSSNTPD